MNDYKVMLNEADSKRDEGEYDTAIKLYSDCLIIKPEAVRVYAQRGYCWYNLDNYMEAIRDFDKTIALKPNVPTTYFFRGRCHEHLENWQNALDDFLESERLKPDEQDVYIRIATMNEKLNRLDEAIESYSKALEFGATADIYGDLGMIHHFRKNHVEAKNCYLKALELDPSHNLAHDMIEDLPNDI